MFHQDLIFNPIQIYCPECVALIDTTIEELQDNSELTCLDCGFVFQPNMNVDNYLKMLKELEGKEVTNLKQDKDQ